MTKLKEKSITDLKNEALALLDKRYYKKSKDIFLTAILLNPRITASIFLEYEKRIQKNFKNIYLRQSLATLLFALNEIENGEMELEEILEIDRQNIPIYNVLGRVYVKTDKIDKAQSLLEKALDLGISDLSLTELLASVYLEKGNLGKAIKFYEEILNQLPKEKRILRILGELHSRVKNYRRASEMYETMFKTDPELTSECIRKLEELLSKDLESIPIRKILSEAYTKSMDPEKATQKLSEIIKIKPSAREEIIARLKELQKIFPNHPQSLLLLIDCLIETENYAEAVENAKVLLKTHSQYTPEVISACKKILSRLLEQFSARKLLAEIYINNENYLQGLEELKQILKIFPDEADWVISKSKDISKKEPLAFEALGYGYLAKGDFYRAVQFAEKLLSINKRSINAHLLLGDVFAKQDLWRKATSSYHRALEIDPFNIFIQQKHRSAKYKELDNEIENLKKKIFDDEWKISLHLELGKIHYFKNEKEEALRELQIALKDSQRAPFIYELMGKIHRVEGRFESAISAYKKGLESSNDQVKELSKKIKFHLGLTYEAQGNIKKALGIFEELYETDIDFPNLKRKIDFLKGSNLASLQNKLICGVISNNEKIKIIGLWSREVKSSLGKEKLDVSFAQNYLVTGFDYFIKGMYQAALDEFTLASQLDPKSIVCLNNLGLTLLVIGKLEEALSKFKNANFIQPNSAVILNNLALTYLLLKKLNLSEDSFKKALGLEKDLSAGLINYGDLAYMMKNSQKAFDLYKKVSPSDVLYDVAASRMLYLTP